MMRGIAGSKIKKAANPKSKAAKSQVSREEFIQNRDYTGALTLLEFQLKCQDGDVKELLYWIGYCSFILVILRGLKKHIKSF